MDAGRDLESAYRATAYVAETPDGPLVLRVGEASAALDLVLEARGVVSWAFVTAHNPGSVPTPAAHNEARHGELCAAVAEAGYFFFEGAGTGEGWPPEASLLVLGMEEAVAAALGRRFGQTAIVVGERGGAARLLWLDRDAG